MKNKIFFASIVFIILLLSSSVPVSSLNKSSQDPAAKQEKTATITCYFSGVPQTTTVTAETARQLQALFTALAKANSQDPQSLETHHLQEQILSLAQTNNLLPAGMTADQVHTSLQKKGERLAARQLPRTLDGEKTDSEYFCNFVTTGDGSASPIIILPRLIPIIQLPIPRLFINWKTEEGFTSVGGLRSRTGFMAEGQQKGTALGFWGIGFSIFLPPISAYGLFGYAMYATVTAENMEQWPPNRPPETSPVNPLDNTTDVSINMNTLQFQISDEDNDQMNYSVTTSPDIGGGNGYLKQDGTYSIPITNLQSSTTYSWTVQVNDGEDTIIRTFTFTTEYLAPQIIDPAPINGAYYVPITLSYLNFTFNDHQHDPIDWSLQTSPDIGSGSGTHVSNGRYSVPIQTDLLQYEATYTWYLNATDGTYPNHQVFTFTIIKEGLNPYLYAGGMAGTVVRYLKEDMTKAAESGSYGGELTSIVSDGQYLYTAGHGSRGTVWQLWPSNLTLRMESSFIGDVQDLFCDGTFIYAGGAGSTYKVSQFWASNLTKKQETVPLPAGGPLCLARQDDYLYAVGGNGGYSFLYQFWIFNMTERQSRTVSNGGPFWSVLAIGPNIYIGTSWTLDGGVVKQYRASDLIEINTVPYGGTIYALGYDGTYLYAGGHDTQKVFKYWPSNLTKVEESQNYGGYINEIAYDGAYLYVAGRSTDRVWQLWPTNLTKKAETPVYSGDLEGLWTG
jgi:hypothetical protein